MWCNIGRPGGGIHCGSHSMHQKQSSSSHGGLISPGERVTVCGVFLWWHGR